jgi:hypothetical protein
MMFVISGLATSDGRKQARYTPTATALGGALGVAP